MLLKKKHWHVTLGKELIKGEVDGFYISLTAQQELI